MAQRNQGLARDNNLSEDIDDGQAINNLAGAGVDQDLFIFINNLNNTSELIWQPSGTAAAIVADSSTNPNRRFLFGTEIPFTFTTNDVIVKVEVRDNLNTDTDGSYTDDAFATDDTEYYIVDLALGQGSFRNQRAFGLATSKGGSPIEIPSAWRTRNVLFTRSDAVTQENIIKIATPEIQNTSDNTGGDIGAASSFSYSIGENFSAAFDTIEANIDVANFKRIQKYSTDSSVSSDRDVRLEGTIRSGDPDAFINTQGRLDRDSNPSTPGVFITDPFSDITDIEATRAFSTSANPWEESPLDSDGFGRLTTQSTQVNIGNLLFADGLKISGLTITAAETAIGPDYGVGGDFLLTSEGGSEISSIGSGYTTGTYDLVGGTGQKGRISLTSSNGAVTGLTSNLTIADGGVGYSINDVLQIDGGDGNAYIKVIGLTAVQVKTPGEFTHKLGVNIDGVEYFLCLGSS